MPKTNGLLKCPIQSESVRVRWGVGGLKPEAGGDRGGIPWVTSLRPKHEAERAFLWYLSFILQGSALNNNDSQKSSCCRAPLGGGCLFFSIRLLKSYCLGKGRSLQHAAFKSWRCELVLIWSLFKQSERSRVPTPSHHNLHSLESHPTCQ